MPAAAACAESFGALAGNGLFPEEAALVERATDKRRQEFAAGRERAREALAALDLGKTPILRGFRGAPQWPPGIVGSITHCAGYCAAAVARAEDLAAIGLDADITINAADGTFTARLLVPAPGPGRARLDGGFTGRWLSRDNLILTAISVPA